MEPTSIRVLLIEDNPGDCRLLRALLGESEAHHFELSEAPRLEEGLAKVAAEDFDVLLVDLSLPDSHGLDTFSRLHSKAGNTPIIVLSGLDDETVAIKAVREGAQDYLVKGKVDSYFLSTAITYAIERHRVERALNETQEHYKRLLDSITDYGFTVEIVDGDPGKATHGPGCEAVTGYSVAEYEADPDLWFRIVHEEDRNAVCDQITQVLCGEMPSPLEHRFLHKDGSTRWVRSKLVPRHDRKGLLRAYDCLIADITERKVAETKLVASESFYHSLVENVPQNILRKDLSERFTFANQRFCNMLGKKLEEIIGKTDFDFYPPELASKYQRDDRRVIETGEIFETVEEYQGANKEKMYVNVVKTPIHDDKGEIIGIQGIFWDITERKRFEERLKKANEELARGEQALRRSHEELKAAQSQLIQAGKMESIGTLAAGFAHEVKNPLAIMLMGLNYLNKKVDLSDQHVAMVLKEMREAVERADSITRNLLEFSAARQLAVTPEPINQLIENTLKLVRHELRQTPVKVVKEFAQDLPAVGVDKNQIQQVLVNLLVNAIHSMENGGTLTLRTHLKQMTETTYFEGSRKSDHFWVGETAILVEVEDTGGGISEAHLARIFDPFFTTKPTGHGTGLGLSVCKKIIELHNGEIGIKNLNRGGVRVTVMLKPYREVLKPHSQAS